MTFRFAALVFLFQLVSAVLLLGGLSAMLKSQALARAEAVAETLRGELTATYARGGAAALAQQISLRRSGGLGGGNVMLLVDARGRPIAGNLNAWPAGIDADSDHRDVTLSRTGQPNPEQMLVRVTALAGGERLLTGVVIDGERQLFALLEQASLVALALALVVAALAAWLTARVIVARLDATVATLAAVRAGDIARRVPDDRSGDAFAALGEQVNFALDRVATLIDELKIATDGLAHDLKSPLTRLRVALERTVAAPDEPSVRAEAERAMGEVDRLQALVETALSISRAEAGIGRESLVEVDLAEMLRTIADLYEPLAEDQGRAIAVEAPPSAVWRVHHQLLDQAIGNLIDNAMTYGAGTITLGVALADGMARITVRDQGPGIAEAQRDQALRRFGRLDSARRGSGAGLGLSLVQAVARLHRGSVALGDAGPGLVVTLTLAT